MYHIGKGTDVFEYPENGFTIVFGKAENLMMEFLFSLNAWDVMLLTPRL